MCVYDEISIDTNILTLTSVRIHWRIPPLAAPYRIHPILQYITIQVCLNGHRSSNFVFQDLTNFNTFTIWTPMVFNYQVQDNKSINSGRVYTTDSDSDTVYFQLNYHTNTLTNQPLFIILLRTIMQSCNTSKSGFRFYSDSY